jgi:hypothetical protein
MPFICQVRTTATREGGDAANHQCAKANCKMKPGTTGDFENAVWTIPKERMKRSKGHNVYLSRQMLDIFIALKTCAGTPGTSCRRATTRTRRCLARPSIASPIWWWSGRKKTSA